MKSKNQLLFNFAVSYSGGGHKRLYEYAKWFNGRSGASFVIHPFCAYLELEFPRNRYFVVSQRPLERLLKDCAYLDGIKAEIGEPDFYHSYGIPVYRRFGKINWFHLSNILPLALGAIPLPRLQRIKLAYLGSRIRRNFDNTEVISAESRFSLEIIEKKGGQRLFLSVNGSDDELEGIDSGIPAHFQDFATVVGTYKYKALDHALQVFESLKRENPQLKLRVIGDAKDLPAELLGRNDVLALGLLQRSEVVEKLRESKYYISMTHIENSYNAASEGLFLAEQSFLSEIGPHVELLQGIEHTRVQLKGSGRTVLHVRRRDATGQNLRTWDEVISEMVGEVERISPNCN